ncbi:CopD family protein [Paenibacillus barcinonensis]|uniref:CopD family protein n=3 Tax=Paenibacillus barcinonensis TaxID=198119 RepID=A0ABX6PZ83_PAEBA|nr:CopD family protein [Paenibacillus barcinonensis]QKS55233.1 CopD family protein [Paenibacillus barcinonensis]
MFSFAEGKAYVWTLIFCILLLMMIRINNTNKNRHLYTAALVLTAIGLIATLSWSSHSSSYFGMQGFWNHLIHLLSVTVWSGILIVTSRMMPNHEKHWRSFLSWYHPFAAAIMVVILMSGLMLNVKTDPDYINSWVTSYGQALLMKHLLMIPLLIMAFFNGFIMKKRLGQEQFNPQRWLMLEGILVLLIYTVTGFLNQQPAPHELNPETMKLSASGLYTFWNQGNPITYPVHWNIDAIAILMYLLAAVSILAMYVILKKNKNTYAALVCGVLFCLVSFAGLIHAIA